MKPITDRRKSASSRIEFEFVGSKARDFNTLMWFDARDLGECHRAVSQLLSAILKYHGPTIARRLFAEASSKRKLRVDKNVQLMTEYIRSGLSVKRFAANLAERNKSLARDYRYGANGTTNPETLEKQIRRQKKLMEQQPIYRKFIEELC